MKMIKKVVTNLLLKYGTVIASCAFAFVVISANTTCAFPYYEPEEPTGLDKFKKFNKYGN